MLLFQGFAVRGLGFWVCINLLEGTALPHLSRRIAFFAI
jgi:hypothetical protein